MDGMWLQVTTDWQSTIALNRALSSFKSNKIEINRVGIEIPFQFPEHFYVVPCLWILAYG